MTDMNVVVLILLYVADYSAPERGAEYCNEYVCPRSYLQKYTSDLQIFLCMLPMAGFSVLLWWRSYTLCTSGFMDDVIFAHKPRFLDVATQLNRSAHAALGLAINCVVHVIHSCRTTDARDCFSGA